MVANAQISRRKQRLALEGRAVIKHFGSSTKFRADLFDLSTVGCRIATQAAIRTGTRLLNKIPGLEFWQGTVVWRRGHDAGVEFERELHPAIVERYAEVFAPG